MAIPPHRVVHSANCMKRWHDLLLWLWNFRLHAKSMKVTLTMVRPSLNEVLPRRVKGFSSSVPQAWLVYPC